MDYIEIEREFFTQFIVGDFDQYVSRKRLDGVWGDDIELQAMSEIYDRPIEIYAYRAEPMRTFHEDQKNHGIHQRRPIRLSYHGNEHYNSVVMVQ
jgi:OTU domain-containing protein 5